MKRFILIIAGCVILILNSCITEYTAKGLNEQENILVVEGLISEGQFSITLSKSVRLTNVNPGKIVYVNHARVVVQCDNGTQIQADNNDPSFETTNGQYTFHIEKLNFDCRYRLQIILEEDGNQTLEYCSEYKYPIETPEIEKVFFTKAGYREPVIIHVTTRSSDDAVLYFQWSYTEDWEIHADLMSFEPFVYPYYCWGKTESRDLLIGSAQRTVEGRLTDRITEIRSTDRKLKVLYRIRVKQHALSKQAYEYFSNIKKNVRETGDIFSPIPSEISGNITCITDPDRPVIGYVEVSTASRNELYLNWYDNVYEYSQSFLNCEGSAYRSTLVDFIITDSGEKFVPYAWAYSDTGERVVAYMNIRCVDCTLYNDSTNRPDDWP